jgi:hypothetical protein
MGIGGIKPPKPPPPPTKGPVCGNVPVFVLCVHARIWKCVCVRVYVCVYVRVRVRVCVHA